MIIQGPIPPKNLVLLLQREIPGYLTPNCYKHQKGWLSLADISAKPPKKTYNRKANPSFIQM